MQAKDPRHKTHWWVLVLKNGKVDIYSVLQGEALPFIMRAWDTLKADNVRCMTNGATRESITAMLAPYKYSVRWMDDVKNSPS